MSTQTAIPIIDFDARKEIQDASYIIESSLKQLAYDVKQLTDHNLSSHHMDMYLDEAKHNIETAIYFRALQKKAYERLEGERI